MSNRSRSSPPERRNAAKYWAGKRTSGSNKPANLSCPPEKPRLPLATISPSSTWAGPPLLRWDGGPVVLQSRAWDEGGNVQPTRAEFIARRGQTRVPVTNPQAFTSQHYNGPTSWRIEGSGEVTHVYA